jgi:primosomal protein N' (replication factor Y)
VITPFYIDVALPVPLRQTFIYLPIKGTTVDSYALGARVKVPFGTRYVVGIIFQVVNTIDSKKFKDFDLTKLKYINKILDNKNILSSNIIELVNFAADYYQHPIGEVYAACLPQLVKSGNDLDNSSNKLVVLNTTATFLLQQKKLTSSQKKLVNILQEHNNSLSLFSLNHLGVKTATINSLVKNNWLLLEKFYDEQHHKINEILKQSPLVLNHEQENAVNKISSCIDRFSCYLLYGITGSGKTEVYLNLIEKVLIKEQQVLVLVPEISLTPQTVHRFSSRFNVKIAVIHSKISLGNKTKDWLAAKEGTAKIIIGTRSAIFTPSKNLGLIIIDEEHDLSFKQQEGFRYHGRDLAIIRAKKLNIPVILGSATPSIESVANVLNHKYELLVLRQRAGIAKLPNIRLLTVKQKKLQAGLSDELIKVIRNKLHNNEQVLLFLNRRGYAPILKCHDCNWGAICERCNVHYTVHKQDDALKCHYCMTIKALPKTCSGCGSVDLNSYGVGTEQIEEFINKIFPKFDCIRIDRDTTQKKDALVQHLQKINTNKPLILLGTQMLAKGHHFPSVTLVAILDIDSSLFSTDFRAPERITQLLVQVAGRAGRGNKASEVIIQTSQPEHKLLQDILSKDYWDIAKELYEIRKIADQPPFSFWVLIRAESYDLNKTMTFLHEIKNIYLDLLKDVLDSHVLGPVLAPRVKKAGLFRGQLLLTSHNRTILHQYLNLLMDKVHHLKTSAIRWSVDVDPQELY